MDSRINNSLCYLIRLHGGVAQLSEEVTAAACELHTVDIIRINVHIAGSLCITDSDSSIRIIADIGRICELSEMSYIVIACSRFRKVALKVLSVFRISEMVDRKVCLHVTFKRKSVSCYTKSNAASEDILVGIVVKISNAQKVDVLIILGSCLTAVVGLGKDIYLLSLIDVTGFKFGNIFSCQNISEISFSLRSKKSYLSARLITVILVIVVPQLGVLVLNNDILLVGVVSCYSYQCVCRCSRTALMRDLYESIKILIICYRGRLCKINIKIVLNVMLGECYGSCIAFLGA